MQFPSYRPLTLAELRRKRRQRQAEVAASLGIDKSNISRLEISRDPKLSSLDGYVEALGGRLVLLALIPLADGRVEKHLLRVEGDTRRDVSIDVLTAPRWRKPAASRPLREAFRARISEAAE